MLSYVASPERLKERYCGTLACFVAWNGPNGLVPVRLLTQDRNDLTLHESECSPLKTTTVRLGEGVAVFGYPLSGMLSTSGKFKLGTAPR